MTSNTKRASSGGGMSIVTVLWIIFLILKLTHVIDWPWYWVFSPIWIAVGLGLLFLIIIGFIVLLAIGGIIRESSRLIIGIKGWFQIKEEQKEHDNTNSES